MKNINFLTGLAIGAMLTFLLAFTFASIDSTKDYRVVSRIDDNSIVLSNIDTGKRIVLEVENSYSQAYEIGQLITIKY